MFEIDCDWPDLWPFNDLIWREFTFVCFEIEVSDNKYVEFHIALIGFHLILSWFKNNEI